MLADANTQKFYLRFNETLVLRSQDINMYLGTRGTGFQSELYFLNDVNLAERFRVTHPCCTGSKS